MPEKKYLIGNWKMNKTRTEALAFVGKLLPELEKSSFQVGLAIPFPYLYDCVKKAEGSSLLIGAQNVNEHEKGAYTGEVSASMLKEENVSFVLIGHSERRHIYQETEEMIHEKLKRALEEGITPILCVGETEEHRKINYQKLLQSQLQEDLSSLNEKDAEKILISYEPVWAIGTGKTATPEIAEEAHVFIREVLEKMFGKKTADKIPLLYGGSVKPENLASLLKKPNINGALVGGASLNFTTFLQMINL